MELGCDPVLVCAPPISRILARNYMTYELPLADWEKSKPIAVKALKELEPSLIVSIERPGVTGDGCYYNMRKVDITRLTAKFDLFFQEGKCPRIAFGDGDHHLRRVGDCLGLQLGHLRRYRSPVPPVEKGFVSSF